MHKAVWFHRFGEEGDRDAADRHWAHQHAQLVLQLPGVRRYVQNVTVTGADSEGGLHERPAADGYSAIWWDDRESYLAALDSSEWQAVAGDGARIFTASWTAAGMSAEVDERVPKVGFGATPDGISTPPAGPVKLVGILRYREGLDRDEGWAYWVGTHGPIGLTIPQMGHYTQNHAIRPTADGTGSLRFDGFSESWYEDMGAFDAAMHSAEWQALVDDGPNLFDVDAVLSLIVEERVLRG
jgi:uncharacterized protein (TIGR02118 family)